MNTIASGKWKEIKGEILKAWGVLTENDLDQTKGNVESLIGLLQERFGYMKEEAYQKLDDIVGHLQAIAQNANEDVEHRLKNTSAKASAKFNQKVEEEKSSLRSKQ